MEEIHATGHLKIHSGKINEFKAIAEQCMKSVREKDTCTLKYDWFINEDQSECLVREEYRDSEAWLEHMANLGETMGQLFAVSDISSIEVFGKPTDQLLKAIAGMDVKYYSLFQKI